MICICVIRKNIEKSTRIKHDFWPKFYKIYEIFFVVIIFFFPSFRNIISAMNLISTRNYDGCTKLIENF